MELSDVKKPKMYSMHEVADFMGVSYMTLYRMVKAGKIKAHDIAKSGNKPLYALTAQDVQDYYDSLQEKVGEGDSEEDPQTSQ